MAMLFVRDEYLCIADCFHEKEKVKAIGAVWNKENKIWVVPFTLANLEICVKKLQNPIIDLNLEEVLEKQKEKENKLAKIFNLSKQNAEINFKIPGIKLPLYNYQKHGVLFTITNNDGVLIADSMGLGKTIQAIGVMTYGKNKYNWKKCLIVTPASLKWNWPLEIEKFTDEKYVVIHGNPKERILQWSREDVYFYICNYELILEDLFGGKEIRINLDDDEKTTERKTKQINSVKQREQILAPIKERTWNCVTIDEGQAIKSHSSKRSKCIKKLKAEMRIALTGTPLDGKLEELHSIMQFVKPGLFESKTRFLQKHAEFDYFGKIIKYKNLDEVKLKIKPFYIRRLKSEVLKDLPDKIYENKIIELSKEERRIYDELADREHPITEDVEAIVKVIRCKQFCNHPELIDISCDKNSKMEMFLEVIDEVVKNNFNKVIVFSQYKKMIDIIDRELKNIGLKFLRIDGDTPTKDRADYQKIFNEDSKIDAIIGTEAMSTGLNLTGASYVINYDDNWAPAIMNQRSDRAHRIGQKDTVTVINFIVRDTIEERIRDMLYNKELLTSEMLGDNIDQMVLKRLNPKEIAELL